MNGNSRKSIRAEIVGQRGRMAQIRTVDGMTGSLPIEGIAPGHLITIIIEKGSSI